VNHFALFIMDKSVACEEIDRYLFSVGDIDRQYTVFGLGWRI